MTDREKEIQETMRRLGLPRNEAEFAVALAHGETTGDVRQVDPREEADLADRVKRHAGVRGEQAD